MMAPAATAILNVTAMTKISQGSIKKFIIRLQHFEPPLTQTKHLCSFDFSRMIKVTCAKMISGRKMIKTKRNRVYANL
jgi:hypothetical protein